jgi:hypothetical protein
MLLHSAVPLVEAQATATDHDGIADLWKQMISLHHPTPAEAL